MDLFLFIFYLYRYTGDFEKVNQFSKRLLMLLVSQQMITTGRVGYCSFVETTKYEFNLMTAPKRRVTRAE